MIHTTEILIPINYEDVQRLFSMYRVKVDKYEHFGAAVTKLNENVKEKNKAYAIM